jgi:hypothetical protein
MSKRPELIRSLIVGILLSSLMAPGFAQADEEERTSFETSTVEKRLRLAFTPEYDLITSGKSSLDSVGFGAGIQYGLLDRWGIGAALRQGFATSGFTSTFTAIDLKVIFAITGSLIQHTQTLKVGDGPMVTSQSINRGGFRMAASLSQYYFNGTIGVFPLTGGGGALSYEFPSQTRLSFDLGARADQVTNGKLTLSPIQFFGGVLFSL